MRNMGRTVKAGEQPMKMIKVRAGTVNRMRELEVLKDELKIAGQDGVTNGEGSAAAAGGEIMQGLYAYSQTEPYVPAPVVDVSFLVAFSENTRIEWVLDVQGNVPKNDFGNIDLYVPSMLPKGAAHIPCRSFLSSSCLWAGLRY